MTIYKNSLFSDFYHKNASIAIGNFDGVHLGHKNIVSIAKQFGVDSFAGVITFLPHPRIFFNTNKTNFLLTSFNQKNQLLINEGMDFIWHQTFDENFAKLSAKSFVNNFLHKNLQVKTIVIGADFVFGYNRCGDANTLKKMANAVGVNVIIADDYTDKNHDKYSASAIRSNISRGEIVNANNMLGREFCVSGTVIKGAQLGRSLGFPTANIELSNYIRPKYGSYAVKCLVNGKLYNGVANIGHKPTISTANQQELLEVHLFHFQNEIYGEKIEVFFHHFLREEKKFPSLNQLKECIEMDCRLAQSLLND